MFMKKQVFLVLALSALLLTACGGNGGNNNSQPAEGGIEDLGTKEIHTELMQRYLADSWDSILTYVPWVSADSGSSSHRSEMLGDVSQPNAIKLEFDEVDDSESYYIQIADNKEFENAKQLEITQKYYNLYNTELGKEYFFRASASEDGLEDAQIKKFKVNDAAPRYVHIDGVINFRDAGGWESSLVQGAKVKQGLYYRCAQFNSITADGKAALKELGIKLDIDMRDNPPSTSPASSTDWQIDILNAAVASGTEDYRWEGKQNGSTVIAQAYKKVFEAIAQADEKPIALHCTHGADRTGIVSYFLLGLLGVSKENCSRDYVMTRFAGERSVLPYQDSRGSRCEIGSWNTKTEALEGATFADKVYKHLNEDFDISVDTLETIREKFVPGYTRPAAA